MPAMRRSVAHQAIAARAISAPTIANRHVRSRLAGEATRASRETLTAIALSGPGKVGGEPGLLGVGQLDPERADPRRPGRLGDRQRAARRMEDVGQLRRLAGLRSEGHDVVDLELALVADRDLVVAVLGRELHRHALHAQLL